MSVADEGILPVQVAALGGFIKSFVHVAVLAPNCAVENRIGEIKGVHECHAIGAQGVQGNFERVLRDALKFGREISRYWGIEQRVAREHGSDVLENALNGHGWSRCDGREER